MNKAATVLRLNLPAHNLLAHVGSSQTGLVDTAWTRFFACLALLLCSLLCSLFSCLEFAVAMPVEKQARKTLLGSTSTINRVVVGRNRTFSPPRRMRLDNSSPDSLSSSTVFEMNLDTAELVHSQNKDAFSLKYYRNLQLRRFYDDNPRAAKYDELDSESFAQNLGLFLSTKSLISALKQSNLGTLYRDVSREAKRIGNYAALSAGRNTAGEIEFVHGEAERSRLFDLRLGVSSRNGIEPRLKLPQDLSVKYDIGSGTTLLEYEIDF